MTHSKLEKNGYQTQPNGATLPPISSCALRLGPLNLSLICQFLVFTNLESASDVVGAFCPEASVFVPVERSSGSPAPSSSASSFSPPAHSGLSAGQNRFFIIKATNAKAVEVSLTHGLWQFGNQTEKRLLKAIKVSGYSLTFRATYSSLVHHCPWLCGSKEQWSGFHPILNSLSVIIAILVWSP